MAGFFDPVRPVEQGPGWNWNPGQTFVTAFQEAQKQKAVLEKNQLDMELEQILMPYKAQKAALELDKLQAETEYLAGHADLQRAQTQQKREMLNGLNATRKALLNLQNKQIAPSGGGGELLLDEPDVPVSDAEPTAPSAQADPYLPVPAASSSESSLSAAQPTEAELDRQIAAMPNSDKPTVAAVSPKDITSDPNGFTSPEDTSNPLIDNASESDRVASLFESLPAPGAATADNASGITPTDVAGMQKNNAAMDAAKKPEPALDKIAKSLPAPEKPSDGLTSFVKDYRSLKSEYGKLAASAANNPAALQEVKNKWKERDLELRNQAQGLYGIPAVEGRGVFQSLVAASDPTLSEIQKLKDKTGSWERAIKTAFTAPKSEKPEKPNEELNSLVYARKELAASLGDTPSPEAKANLDRLDQQIEMAQRKITPEQAQQEKATASRSYQLGEISKWIGGAEPEKKAALLNLNSLIEKGEIPTISLKQNKDGKILYSKADQALLSKVEDGMPFAAVDSTGTRQILRKDSNSSFGFSRWGKLGDTASTTPTAASSEKVAPSQDNPFAGRTIAPDTSRADATQAAFDKEELGQIEREMNDLLKINRMTDEEYRLAYGNKPFSDFGKQWDKLSERKKALQARIKK